MVFIDDKFAFDTVPHTQVGLCYGWARDAQVIIKELRMLHFGTFADIEIDQ